MPDRIVVSGLDKFEILKERLVKLVEEFNEKAA